MSCVSERASGPVVTSRFFVILDHGVHSHHFSLWLPQMELKDKAGRQKKRDRDGERERERERERQKERDSFLKRETVRQTDRLL